MSNGYRQAALRLHGMGESDRDWLLQRLDPAERTQLTALLAELRELGIRPDHGSAQALHATAARERLLASVPERSAMATALDVLSVANGAEMMAVLAAEPEHVVSAILSAYTWPWRDDFLAACAVEKRQRLSRLLRQESTIKPRAAAALVAILADRIAAMRMQGAIPPLQPAPLPGRFQTRRESKSLVQRIKQWLS